MANGGFDRADTVCTSLATGAGTKAKDIHMGESLTLTQEQLANLMSQRGAVDANAPVQWKSTAPVGLASQLLRTTATEPSVEFTHKGKNYYATATAAGLTVVGHTCYRKDDKVIARIRGWLFEA